MSLGSNAQKIPEEMRLSPDGRRLTTGNFTSTGFYEQASIRDIYLDFSDPDFWDELKDNYGSDDNIRADMTIDGVLYPNVGVRFKGNSSYSSSNNDKKSFNITLDAYVPDQEIDGYSTLNLNNCHGDPSYMAEVFFETQIRKHVPAPKGNFAHLFINGDDWGIYANVQQVNKDFLKEWFITNDGALWRAKRPEGSPASSGTDGDSLRSLYYLGSDTMVYAHNYELKSNGLSQPHGKLKTMTQVMATVSTSNMESVLGDHLDIDRTLWFLASEIAFGDDDGYAFEGRTDYKFYLEKETGRFVPLEFDGNGAMDNSYENLSIFLNADEPNYALLHRLLNHPNLRQRYLAHMRTIVQEEFDLASSYQLIDSYYNMINPFVQNDPVANYSYSSFVSHRNLLKDFVSDRRDYILNNSEIDEDVPSISNSTYFSGSHAWQRPQDDEDVYVTTSASSPDGIDKVTLYIATGLVGKFSKQTMYDDGNHHDGASGDGVYGATISGKDGGTWVRFYIEATSDNSDKTVVYDPPGAEHDIYTYLVEPAIDSDPSIVINEVMAINTSTVTDDAGEFEDWIEIFNNSTSSKNLSNYILTDDEFNLTKWEFPNGTTIPAGGFLIVWLDDDGNQVGLHANFKLSGSGEHLLLLNDDGELVDEVSFGQQVDNLGYARVPNGSGAFVIQTPTFNSTNTPAPQALFTSSETAGCLPLSVNFLNNSDLATSYSWDFGDGTTSNLYSPAHTYTTSGIFTVSLVATNNNGSDTYTFSVEVFAVPNIPTIVSEPRCGSGRVILSASSSGTISWYSDLIGGTLLQSGFIFTSPILSSTTTYYVEAANTKCKSSRVAVEAIVTPIPPAPWGIDASGCNGGIVTLQASSSHPITWYDMPVAGTVLSTGHFYTSPTLHTSQTYYAIAGDDCKSPARAITAHIHPNPSVDLGPDTIWIQSGQTATLDPGDEYQSYLWSTGETTQTIDVNSVGFYEITVTDANGCTATDLIYVEMSVGVMKGTEYSELNLHPNPASENVFINWSSANSGISNLSVYAIDGRILLSKDSRSSKGEFSETIDVKDYSAGLYFIRISDENSLLVKKFTVRK